MSDVINWLNSNQGFVMIILTFVYVVATIIIVIYNRKSIKELQRGREEESRPYIFANLHKDPRDVCFYFVVKNHGKTGGKILSLSVSPGLKFAKGRKIEEFLKDTIIAPGQAFQFIVLEKSKETSSDNYTVSLKYTSTISNKNVYQEEYTIITQYSTQLGFADNNVSNLNDEANALNNIARYLDSIRIKL